MPCLTVDLTGKKIHIVHKVKDRFLALVAAFQKLSQFCFFHTQTINSSCVG